MGLEIVEMFMRIEDEFGIEMSQEEAQTLDTVGKMRDFVMRKLHLDGRARVCASQWTFYQLRAALADALSVQSRCIRPESDLYTLIPVTWSESSWSRISQATGFTILPPGRNRDSISAFLLGALSYGGCTFLWLAPIIGPTFALPIALTIGLLLALLPLPSRRPAGLHRLHTMRELVHLTMASNLRTVASATGGMSHAEVLAALAEIIHDETEVPRELIVAEAHFERDLKLG